MLDPPEVQGVGWARWDQFDVLRGSCNSLRGVDHDIPVFPTVLRIQNVPAKRINKVKPLIPEGQPLLAGYVSAVEVLPRATEELG